MRTTIALLLVSLSALAISDPALANTEVNEHGVHRTVEITSEPVDIQQKCAITWTAYPVMRTAIALLLVSLTALASCDPTLSNAEVKEHGVHHRVESPEQPVNCDVTKWSEYSPCSATCGLGVKYRQRQYIHESSKYVCIKHLTTRASCWGPLRYCPNHIDIDDPKCALSDWSEWSSCTVTCGKGSRSRDRRFLTRNAPRHCYMGLRRPKFTDVEPCEGVFSLCEGDDNEEEIDNTEIGYCPDRPWSDWSPCSTTCGNGFKVRTRDPVNTEIDYDDDNTNEDELDPCEDERDKQVVECIGTMPTCDISSTSAEDKN